MTPDASAAPEGGVRGWLNQRSTREWLTVVVAGFVLVGLVRWSRDAAGSGEANILLGVAAALAVIAFFGYRYLRSRDVKDWTTLLLTLAVVYALLASFSVRQGNLGETYLVTTAFTMAIFALLALGLSVQMGYAGLLNFGHVAFMGIGGYFVAVWTTELGAKMAPTFQGSGPGAIIMTGVTALLGGLLVYAPVLLVVQRLPLAARWRTLIAAAPAAVVAILIATSMFPLDARAAMSMVVLLGVLLGVLAAVVASLLLGLASLRLREDYLAIVTLGTAEIIRLIATNEAWLTNGSLGVLLRTSAHHMPISAWTRQSEAFRDWAREFGVGGSHALLATTIVAILVLALAFVLLEALARSPWGRVLKSIREDEEVAAALGKNVLLYKLQALMIGAALAAMAGILFVWNKTNVYPTDFLPIVTFYTVAILVLGGIGNHKGAILGAVIIWGIFEFSGSMNNAFRTDCVGGNASWFVSIFCDFAGPKQQLLIGLVLILVILFRPQGAVGNKEELAHAK